VMIASESKTDNIKAKVLAAAEELDGQEAHGPMWGYGSCCRNPYKKGCPGSHDMKLAKCCFRCSFRLARRSEATMLSSFFPLHHAASSLSDTHCHSKITAESSLTHLEKDSQPRNIQLYWMISRVSRVGKAGVCTVGYRTYSTYSFFSYKVYEKVSQTMDRRITSKW
jgi:hypothetical protein